MNNKNLYLITLMFLGFMLYIQWQKDYNQPQQLTEQTQQPLQQNSLSDLSQTDIPAAQNVVDNEIPQPRVAENTDLPVQTNAVNGVEVISVVETPLLKLEFAAEGAALVYAELKKYPLKKKEAEHVVLMDHRKNYFQAESGLVGQTVNFTHKDLFTTEAANVSITDQVTEVTFVHQKAEGQVVKTYTIDPTSYAIKVTQQLTNNTNDSWVITEYQQMKRNDPWQGNDPSFTDAGRYSFKGVGYFDSEEGYETVSFEDMQEGPLKQTLGNDNWVAMVQHYFFAGIIPSSEQVEVQTQYSPNTTYPYLARLLSPAVSVAPQSSVVFNSTWYVGPKLQKELPEIAKGLDLTVDYGVFTAISKPLFWVLEKIHGLVGNWGWSIVLLTVLIKLLFFKLSEAQYKSMARMRKLQPRITILKERYKDDKQKFNQEMMGLYQKEKVNPLGGCLPILIQIPVFIALYWVLLESVELRQAPFILWLQDLSTPDPYFILPAINAAAMIMTQRLSPTPGMDPMQAKIMKAMPIVFSIMFAFFQSGLVLYWAVNSVLSLAQQWVITKRIEEQDDKK